MTKGSEYYGGFFWLATVSFIVPLFVGYKAFESAKPATKPTPVLDASGVSNEIWDYLLKTYVANGLVDYDGMRKDHLFAEYLRQIGSADPDKLPSDNHRLALMCNAYNALVINGVILHKKPTQAVAVEVNGVKFFDIKEHIFAGKTISLNDLEHGMIRPIFKEPRIHVALVCAALSCPALRSEAYTGERVIEQLEDQSKLFANNPKHVNFDPATQKLVISRVLGWYGSDFDARYPDGSWLKWLVDLVDSEDLNRHLQAGIAAGLHKTMVEDDFAPYDWTLNSQADPGKASGASFGSGSVPNE